MRPSARVGERRKKTGRFGRDDNFGLVGVRTSASRMNLLEQNRKGSQLWKEVATKDEK